MTAYFLAMMALLIPAIMLPQRNPTKVAWVIAFLSLVVLVGLRHKVGMDWNNYLVMLGKVDAAPYVDSLRIAEPAYATLLWLSGNSGLGVYGVNIASATLLLLGVFKFSKVTALPWVALVCAMPVLVVVVGMSANRQAAAIGILMWLVAVWDQTQLRSRVALIVSASLFHFSAIVFLGFAVLGLRMRPVYKSVAVGFLFLLGFAFLQLSGGAEYYDQAYLSGQSELTYSPGATQHVLLNGLPALLILSGARLRAALFPTPILRQMAWMAVLLIPLAFFFSTAAGRMTLYLFPVSMFVLAGLAQQFRGSSAKAIIRTLISVAQLGVLWVWLNYANSSIAYVPYENVLWLPGWELHL